jgi:hypothetical protein
MIPLSTREIIFSMNFILYFCLYIVSAIVTDQDYYAVPQYELIIDRDLMLNETEAEVRLENGKIKCLIEEAREPSQYSINTPNIKLALEALKSMPCLYNVYPGRYWAYEFCFNKHILQFHQTNTGEPVKKEDRYLLGKVSRISSSLIQDNVIDGVLQPTLIQIWEGGSTCDLNGMSRNTKVEYICSPEERIASIREVSTCSYSLILHTPRLCSEFSGARTAEVPKIRCTTSDDPSVMNLHECLIKLTQLPKRRHFQFRNLSIDTMTRPRLKTPFAAMVNLVSVMPRMLISQKL